MEGRRSLFRPPGTHRAADHGFPPCPPPPRALPYSFEPCDIILFYAKAGFALEISWPTKEGSIWLLGILQTNHRPTLRDPLTSTSSHK
jgi:hypothetical protein